MKDAHTHASEAPAPPAPALRLRGLVFRLYTSNPFYVISADLVFVGLRMSCDTRDLTFGTWALMLGLAGYTLLLAATACLLIRHGKVWEDVRSLLLLVVMMFLAMSVTFDNTLARKPLLGAVCYLAGFLFAIAVTEVVLRSIRLSMPPWYRLPYYLLLGLFFVYPVALSPLLTDPLDIRLQWALFGFSPVAGLVSLSLLPAIRRGPEYVRHNGSPWTWPLYPWVLFGFLGVAVCARSSYLCVSLHFVDRTLSDSTNTIFGPYFLIPFLLALCVLVLELGIVARSRAVLRTALLMPPVLVVLACLGHPSAAVHQRFLASFIATLGGTPLFLTLLAIAGFYGVATLRGVPLAYGGLAATLLALSAVEPGARGLGKVTRPEAWPLVVLGLTEAWIAIRKRDSTRSAVAAVCLVTATMLGLPDHALAVPRAVIVFHAAIGAALLIGALFDDELGRLLRSTSACALFIACAAVALGNPQLSRHVPAQVLTAYPPVVAVLAILYGSLVRDRAFYLQAAASLAAFLVPTGWRGYVSLRQVVAGLDHLTGGLAFFVLAALISLKKAGALPRRFAMKWRQNEL